MSLTTQRQGELAAIATNLNALTPAEKLLFNAVYEPDVIVYGCNSIPSGNPNIAAIAESCEGMTYEEIEFLHAELNSQSPQNSRLGIKPGSKPSGPGPTGNK